MKQLMLCSAQSTYSRDYGEVVTSVQKMYLTKINLAAAILRINS